MAYEIEIKPAARRRIKKLTRPVQARLVRLLETLRQNPRPQGHQALSDLPKGVPPLYRVRVGNYRVVYAIEDDRLIVVVVLAGDRREVYDLLQRLLKNNPQAAASTPSIQKSKR